MCWLVTLVMAGSTIDGIKLIVRVALVLPALLLPALLLPAPAKISTGREKLAPAGWHGWHVFATLGFLDEQK